MNLLYLSQGYKISDHPGYHNACLKLHNEGFIDEYLNIPFYGYAQEHGWEGFYKEVVKICKERSFDLVFFGFFMARIF